MNVFISGASRGLGLCLTECFAREGQNARVKNGEKRLMLDSP